MQGLPAEEYPGFVDFIHRLADDTVKKLFDQFRAPILVENKHENNESLGFDPVTGADREAEQVITDAITAAWPDHEIVGEEFGVRGAGGDYRWTIDPIDGTRAFLAGLPTWGTLVALSYRGRSCIGLMSQPFTGERYWNDAEATHYRGPGGERRLKTSQCATISDALLATTDPFMFGDGAEERAFAALRERARITRYGGDCYSYCQLAAGFIDVIVETWLKPYDIAALVPIVRQAGGVISTWQGDAPEAGGQIVATANARLHEEVISVLNLS